MLNITEYYPMYDSKTRSFVKSNYETPYIDPREHKALNEKTLFFFFFNLFLHVEWLSARLYHYFRYTLYTRKNGAALYD